MKLPKIGQVIVFAKQRTIKTTDITSKDSKLFIDLEKKNKKNIVRESEDKQIQDFEFRHTCMYSVSSRARFIKILLLIKRNTKINLA